MNESLKDRLNQIYAHVTRKSFLAGHGIGNEISFYVFDYPPSAELGVRRHIQLLTQEIQRSDIQLASINLFEFLVDHLKERRLLEKAFQMQKARGDDALLKALKGVLNPERVANNLASRLHIDQQDLVLLHGVGSAYPLVRTHSLLSNLQTRIGTTPLVMFFPGTYSEGRLELFSGSKRASEKYHYYRALRLIN